MNQIIIPKIVPHCTGDGCQLPGEHICAKCGTMVCELVGGIIGDEGMKSLVKRYEDGHAVYCMYCRFIAQPHVFCGSCAGSHELMLNFRGSCRTAFASLHESAYGNDGNMVVGRTTENATDLSDRRFDKYRRMDSTNPEGAKLVRSQAEQDQVFETEEIVEDGETIIRQVEPTTNSEGS